MLAQLKRMARSSVRSCAGVIVGTRLGRILVEEAVSSAMGRTAAVSHGGASLRFAAPNALVRARVDTFSSKEPETLAWIDSIPGGATLWDIGANVGLYTCYAAQTRHCRVIAFEPSVFNLELLARNVFLNELTERVTIVPVPLCEQLTESTLNLTSVEWGGALSSFAATHGFDGETLRKVFEFRTVGLSMDEAVARLALPPPHSIKIDVDGIEHLILRGGHATLQCVQSVSIEINDDFALQAQECRRLLEAAGLRFIGKAHSALIDANPLYNRTFNQVWAR